MSEDKYIRQLMDKLTGQLTEHDAASFKEELAKDPERQEDYEFFQKAWKGLDKLEVPVASDRLRTDFYSRLDQEIAAAESVEESTFQRFWKFISRPAVLAVGSIQLLLLAVVFMLGSQLNGKKPDTIQVIAIGDTQDPAEKEKLANYVQATQRLEEIYNIADQPEINDQTVQILLATLANDPNVNVRLTALEELSSFTADSKVRQQLVKHIKKESSPLVQIELLNVLQEKHPRESIGTMENLLDKQKDLDPLVRKKIERDLPLLRAAL